MLETRGDGEGNSDNDSGTLPGAGLKAKPSDSLASMTPAMDELATLVAMPLPSAAAVINRLSNQTYSRLGRNLLFEVRPTVST